MPGPVDHDPVTNRQRYARLATAAVGGGILVLTAVGATMADPPGNNATIKVDNEPLDTHPDNEPHVDCVFEVDFYGYDEGDLTATVIFTAMAPTKGTKTFEDEVFVGEDAAGGGTDLDAERKYDQDDLADLLAGIEPNPEKQGWHIKVEVDEPGGSIGAVNKFKVYWVSGCDNPPGPTTTTTTTRPGETTTTTRPGDTTTSTRPGNGNGRKPTPTPPAATPVEPDGPIILAG